MKCWLTCILLWNTCWAKATDRSPSAEADSLYAAGSFALAGLEYERAYFKSTDEKARALALLKKSYCLKQQKDLAGAYTNLQRVEHHGLGDSLEYAVRYEKVLCAYLISEYGNAEYELQQMDFFIADTSFTNQALFLRALVLSELEKWTETEITMRKYFATRHIRTDTMNFSEWLYPKGLRSAKTAKLLSLVVPGLGQWYSGHGGRALSSLLLQGAAATFAVISIMNGFPLQGIFTGTVMFLRFYGGGARYAGRLAEERNEKRKDQVKEKVRSTLMFYERI
jgi:hypothetical protein